MPKTKSNGGLYVVVHVSPDGRATVLSPGNYPECVFRSKDWAHDMGLLAKEELKEVYPPEEHEEQIGVVKICKLEPTGIEV